MSLHKLMRNLLLIQNWLEQSIWFFLKNGWVYKSPLTSLILPLLDRFNAEQRNKFSINIHLIEMEGFPRFAHFFISHSGTYGFS